jgi:hypothetical protein
LGSGGAPEGELPIEASILGSKCGVLDIENNLTVYISASAK